MEYNFSIPEIAERGLFSAGSDIWLQGLYSGFLVN